MDYNEISRYQLEVDHIYYAFIQLFQELRSNVIRIRLLNDVIR
jgi:hypothetical protein